MNWIFQRKQIFNEMLEKKRFIVTCLEITRKVPDPCIAKEQYETFLKQKNRTSVKQSEVNSEKPKTFDTVDIKSVITEHPKTLHKLCKTIRKGEKVDSNSSSYSDTKK